MLESASSASLRSGTSYVDAESSLKGSPDASMKTCQRPFDVQVNANRQPRLPAIHPQLVVRFFIAAS